MTGGKCVHFLVSSEEIMIFLSVLEYPDSKMGPHLSDYLWDLLQLVNLTGVLN